jgi:hypothetical protein
VAGLKRACFSFVNSGVKQGTEPSARSRRKRGGGWGDMVFGRRRRGRRRWTRRRRRRSWRRRRRRCNHDWIALSLPRRTMMMAPLLRNCFSFVSALFFAHHQQTE